MNVSDMHERNVRIKIFGGLIVHVECLMITRLSSGRDLVRGSACHGQYCSATGACVSGETGLICDQGLASVSGR